MASRYPALASRIRAEGDRDPTIHDAATAAVEHKGSGSALDAGVGERVGAHLGADFSGVRVHQDPLSQEATAAMGARAFAYGGDVFLGPGESGGDLGLLAHELTHVVQQGAAGRRAPQRQVQVGDANSPAEHQADQVAAEVTAGTARPAQLLADDGPLRSGQMLKSQFLEQLRAQVTAAADQELGPVYSAIGCPYIEQYFGRYAGQPAAAGEALIKRFAPAARGASTAAEMIPLVVARVRDGVRTWRDTGQPPPDLAAAEPAAAAASEPAQAQALRAPDGSETVASLEAALGPGASLDGTTAHRMSAALGADVSSARVHTGAVAARKADDAGALAFTVGNNVVMGHRAPAPGTLEGDALLAHELTHVAQQQGAAADPVARRQPIAGESAAAEAHADAATAGALVQLHGQKTGMARFAERMGGVFKSGLQLQRCQDNDKKVTPSAAQQASSQKLAHLNGLSDADFRKEVDAMSKADTELLLDNISSADQTTYATLIKKIKDERLTSTAESLQGKLYWAGNSGGDSSDGYRIRTQTTRPKDNDLLDGVVGNQMETNDNDFAKWVRGLGPEPTDTSKMNCWEMVLFAGYKAGVIPKAWIASAHDDAAKAGAAASSTGAYQTVLASRLNFTGAAAWSPGTAVPRGNLVFFDGLTHVALATGNVVGGKQEVMSLWVFPSTGAGLLNSATQRTTIEDLLANGVVTVTSVKFGPNPW